MKQPLRLKELYFSAKRIRLIEEFLASHYSENHMRCPMHFSIGQELAGAAVGLLCSKSDRVVSTHRSHAHFLGKGGCLSSMIAEFMGKDRGCSGGRGGSMHLIDKEVGFEASTAIVGNSIPVAVGLAAALKRNDENKICVAFVGDATFETGVLFESLNISATWDLPILFVCENNLYSVYSPLSVRQPKNRDNAELARAMGLRSLKLDGTDAAETLLALQSVISDVRKNRPYLVELSTYRWLEHCGPNSDDALSYRHGSELQYWKEHDFLTQLEERLIVSGEITSVEVAACNLKINREIKLAYQLATELTNNPSSDFRQYEYAP